MKINEKFFDPEERIGKVCPKCGSKNIVYLMYGLIEEGRYEKEIANGEIALMCCGIDGKNLYCKDCEYDWASTPLVLE